MGAFCSSGLPLFHENESSGGKGGIGLFPGLPSATPIIISGGTLMPGKTSDPLTGSWAEGCRLIDRSCDAPDGRDSLVTLSLGLCKRFGGDTTRLGSVGDAINSSDLGMGCRLDRSDLFLLSMPACILRCSRQSRCKRSSTEQR